MNALTNLLSHPLFMERNSLEAFFQHNAGRASIDPPKIDRARLCGSCDDELPEPPARYLRVLKYLRLAAPIAEIIVGSDQSVAALNDTAIITFNGPIVKHADEWECEIFGLTDLDDIDAAIAAVSADENIRNVLLNFVNCPGGTSIGVAETADKVYALAQKKNVFTFSDSFVASAGIYIGSQASQLFVTASTYSGSIGVIIPAILDFSKNLQMNGITPHIIKAGKFKDTGTSLRPPTQEELDMLDAQIARQKAGFDKAVKRGRPAIRTDAMQGQLFVGAEAGGGG